MVPVKHGMIDLIIALKESEIKLEAMPVHMHQVYTATKQLKDKCEIPIVTVHAGNINKNTTLCVNKEEELRQATVEDHDLRNIKSVLSSP